MTDNYPGGYRKANRVDLDMRGNYDEGIAIAACPVASLLMMYGDGARGVQPHNVVGGICSLRIAVDHKLEGGVGGIVPVYAWDDWKAGEIVQYMTALRADKCYALAANGYAYTDGMLLCSAGDGTLMPLPADSVANEQLYESVAAGSSVTNTNTITAFTPNYTLAAAALKAGDVIRIHAAVSAPTTNSTDTLTITIKIGTTVIVATGAVDVANGDEGVIDAILTVRTIGAAGTIIGNGNWTLGVPGTATTRAFTLASTAIDTTATQQIQVFATWSATSAGDIATLDELEINLDRSVTYAALATVYEDSLDLTTTSTTSTTVDGFYNSGQTSPANAIRIQAL